MHIHHLQSAFSDCVDVIDIIFERESESSHWQVIMEFTWSTKLLPTYVAT